MWIIRKHHFTNILQAGQLGKVNSFQGMAGQMHPSALRTRIHAFTGMSPGNLE